MSAAVEISGLRVVRGGHLVLPDLDLTLAGGEITGLAGPSGCGKTTLMRCIVGVQQIAAGEVRVLGRPAGHPELRRRIAYTTQSPSVYADLTVEQNLRYFASVIGAGRDGRQRAIEQVGLSAQVDQRAGSLSGGQLARASLAAALLGDPELLVLDEPTVGLDPLLRTELWALFRDLADQGRTLLVSSHVMDEVERCDRLALMRDGRILSVEPPAALRRRTEAETMDDAFLALLRDLDDSEGAVRAGAQPGDHAGRGR